MLFRSAENLRSSCNKTESRAPTKNLRLGPEIRSANIAVMHVMRLRTSGPTSERQSVVSFSLATIYFGFSMYSLGSAWP